MRVAQGPNGPIYWEDDFPEVEWPDETHDPREWTPHGCDTLHFQGRIFGALFFCKEEELLSIFEWSAAIPEPKRLCVVKFKDGWQSAALLMVGFSDDEITAAIVAARMRGE